jgi:hypothetical protein
MRNSYSANAARSAVTSALTNPFTRSLMISMLMTGFDASVLIVAGRYVLDAFNEVPWLAVAFCFAAIGLLLTLARIWFLTFRLARAN